MHEHGVVVVARSVDCPPSGVRQCPRCRSNGTARQQQIEIVHGARVQRGVTERDRWALEHERLESGVGERRDRETCRVGQQELCLAASEVSFAFEYRRSPRPSVQGFKVGERVPQQRRDPMSDGQSSGEIDVGSAFDCGVRRADIGMRTRSSPEQLGGGSLPVRAVS